MKKSIIQLGIIKGEELIASIRRAFAPAPKVMKDKKKYDRKNHKKLGD